jgi:integrase
LQESPYTDNFVLLKFKIMLDMYEDYSVSFFIKRKKVLKSGESTIFVKIYKDGNRSEFATDKTILPSQWDSKNCKAKGNSRVSNEINFHLEKVRVHISLIAEKLVKEGYEPTPNLIKEHIIGKISQKSSLLQLFQEHNDKAAKLEGIDFAPATVQRYETSFRHTKEFIKHQYGRQDVSFDEINHSFIEDYEFYLKTEVKCSHNTAIKYLRNFKKIVRLAMSNGWIKADPFINKKLSCKPTDRLYLDADELDLIIKKEIKIPRLELVQDLFIFSCFTGLPYSDIISLTPDELVKDKEGTNWIDRKRTKNSKEYQVPLINIPLRLIEKYKDHPGTKNSGKVFPSISNQNYNAYLKEICDICGIKKNITTHCARHTFGTTVTLSNGISIEAVSKMLGHTNLSSTKIYARITEKLVKNNMKKIQNLYA